MNKKIATKILATCLTVFIVTAAFVMPTSVAQSQNAATPFTAGPVNPKNGGALWVQDSNGLTLQLCLNPDLCFFDPVDPGNPYSVRVGFGPEAFWWLAESSIKIDANKNTKHPGLSALIVMGVEFAWNNEVPEQGEQFPFTRLRFRLDVPKIGTYYVTHPYGEDIFEVTQDMVDEKGNIERIFVSHDIPFTAAAQNQGKIGPFLKREYSPGDPGAPDGFISGGLDDVGPVTGSPLTDASGLPQNYFEVKGVAPDGKPIDLDGNTAGVQDVVRTYDFAVMGQIATRHGVQVNRADYDLDPLDPGIAVFASTLALTPAETINVSVAGLTPTPMVAGPSDPTGVWRRYFAFIVSNAPPPSITVTNTLDPAEESACLTGDAFGPSCESSVVRKLIDTVTITNAYFTRTTGELEIVASSTDPSATLTAFADDGTMLGVLTDGLLEIFNVAVPPAQVTVKSSFGGADTEPVDAGFCERAGSSTVCKK